MEGYPYKTKWLVFTRMQVFSRKTDIVFVRTLEHRTLGQIRWHGAWRQFVFFPEAGCMFNRQCLADINAEIEKLMAERRK